MGSVRTPKVVTEYEYAFEFIPLKSGKPGKRNRYRLVAMHEWCPVRQCRNCGWFGSPLHVQYRPLLYRFLENNRCILCMSCWNKLRALSRQQDELNETARLIGKLKREAKHGHEVRRVA